MRLTFNHGHLLRKAAIYLAYIVTAKDLKRINFAPSSVVEEVLQNVRTLLNTIRGEVVLDRAFGMPADIVDMPIQKAQAALSSAIFTQIKRYEPRATVVQISFKGGVSGKLDPVVEVRIHETE